MTARLAGIHAILSNETRLSILYLLAEAPYPVTTIAAETGVSMATASQNLHALLRGELIAVEPRGTQRWYSLRQPLHPVVEATLNEMAKEGAELC